MQERVALGGAGGCQSAEPRPAVARGELVGRGSGGGSEADSQVVLRRKAHSAAPSYAISSDDEDGDEGSPDEGSASGAARAAQPERRALDRAENDGRATGVGGSQRPLAHEFGSATSM